MPSNDRFLGSTVSLLRLLLFGNYLALAVMLAALISTFVFVDPLTAQLTRKYHGIVEISLVIGLLRVVILIGLACTYPFGRLLGSLQAIIMTVRMGDPFIHANASRLRIIGWSLFALQLIDIAVGVAVWWARRHHIEVVDWQPSLIGWLGVFVAFVLARAFAIGAAMREDMEGTI